MGRAPFIGVHVYDFDTKNPGRPDKPSPWVVRWRVGGATKLGSRSFKHLGDAKRFHRQLENAADDGERFDSETLLPVSMLAAAATTSIADIAFRFYQKNMNTWSPRSRESAAEPLASLLLIATRKNRTTLPPGPSWRTAEQQMRSDIYDWLLSDQTKKKATPMPSWLAKNSLAITAITKELCVQLSKTLDTRQDGKTKAVSTRNRTRNNINAMFKFALDQNLIVRNPWPEVEKERQVNKAPKSAPADETVRFLPDTPQFQTALHAMATPLTRPGGAARQVLIAIIYYAGLRPSEAAALRIEDCIELPEDGWGTLRVTQANKSTFDKRWMKDSPAVGLTKTGETRTLLIPQELVVILRNYIGDRTEGLLAPDERGGMMHSGNLASSWRRVRQNPNWRPYDLRAARASLHVNAGRPRSEVAREMGHSAAILDKYYLGVSETDASAGLTTVTERLDTAPKKRTKAAVKKASSKKVAVKKQK